MLYILRTLYNIHDNYYSCFQKNKDREYLISTAQSNHSVHTTLRHYKATTAQTTVNTQHTELLNTLKDKSDCTRRVATALLPGSVKLFEILYDQLW